MTFFRNNPAHGESQQPATENTDALTALSESSPYSGKSQPLFKQGNVLPDTLAGQHISLSAYISKHLQDTEGNPALAEPESSTATGFRTFPTPAGKVAQHATGQILNSLDVEMAAGLEQYLPSPLFRLRIAKKRLDREITELRQRLNKYDRLPEQSPELKERIASLKIKLKALEANLRHVNEQLVPNPGWGRLLNSLSQPGRWVRRMLHSGLMQLRAGLLTVFYGHKFWEMQHSSNEIVYLKELYAEHLKDHSNADAELSAILHRFEQVVQRMEQGAKQTKPISFVTRLWQDVKRLVK